MKTKSKTKWCLLFLLVTTSVTLGPPAFAQMFPRRGEEQFAPRRPFQPSGPAEGEANDKEKPRRRGGLFGEGFEQRREQRRQRIERVRNLTRRILEDPNTPADTKTKARHLDELLTQREKLEDELVATRQGFLRNHQQELDELRQLHERAEVLRQNLRSSREKAIAENLPKIQEMRRLTQEAREAAQELRQQYRRGGRGQEPEGN